MDDAKVMNFKHMELSFKGSERQRPNVLQQALRFQVILADAAQPITEANLLKLASEWNSQPLISSQKRWQISKDSRIAIANLSLGVAKETLAHIKNHLNFWKWNECCTHLHVIAVVSFSGWGRCVIDQA